MSIKIDIPRKICTSETNVDLDAREPENDSTYSGHLDQDLKIRWPHYPILLCDNTSTHILSSAKPLPIGVSFEFHSDLFIGQCLVRIRNINENDDGYFSGRKRLMQVIIQGKFKEELNVGDVLSGHEFCRPFVNIHSHFLMNVFSTLIKKISPSTDISINSNNPYILAPLATGMQTIAINKPGEEPSVNNFDLDEDMTLMGGYFSKSPSRIPPSKRKLYFSRAEAARKHVFDTSNVYTFEFYQDLLDLSTYSLRLGLVSLSLERYLNGQPIQIMSKAKDGRYLWNFQVWHASLLRYVHEI